jgi:hypothetical protein
VAVFVISTVAIPVFGGLSLAEEAANGVDIYAFKSLCTANYILEPTEPVA